jgi:peptidyl-prolyl cis-trans isomerase D
MDRLRDGASSIWIKIILGLIILSFIFAGIGSYLAGGSGPKPAAKVGDQKISQQQFEQAYQSERNRIQSQLGEYFSTLMSNPQYVQQLRESVLNRLVNNVLIEQRAKKLGLHVSDTQIRDAIFAIPAFQQDGAFNNTLYNDILARSGITPDQFAVSISQDLLRQQYLDSIESSDFTLNNQLTMLSQLENQQREVRTITLDLAKFKAEQNITDKAAKLFYDENSQQFTRPEQLKASYIELTADTVKNTIKVTSTEAKAFYDENQSQYSTPEKIQVSHILIDGTTTADQTKAEAILQQLKDGADFATLAEKDSSDTFSAKTGGQLDWFAKGSMDSDFEKAAFELTKVGQLALVKTQFGFHVVKLDGIEKPEMQPFNQVESKIIAQMQQEKVSNAFYKLQQTLAQQSFEHPDSLAIAAKSVDLTVKTTDFFSSNQAPSALNNPKILKALMSTDVHDDGLNSDVIDLGNDHAVVVRVEETRPSEVLPFEQVEAKVKTLLATQKGEDAAEAQADKLVGELRTGKTDEVKLAGYVFSSPELLTRTGSPDAALAKVAFRLPHPEKGNSAYGISTKTNGDVVIVALDKVISPTADDVSSNNAFIQKVAQMNAQEDLDATLTQLRDGGDVSFPAESSTN